MRSSLTHLAGRWACRQHLGLGIWGPGLCRAPQDVYEHTPYWVYLEAAGVYSEGKPGAGSKCLHPYCRMHFDPHLCRKIRTDHPRWVKASRGHQPLHTQCCHVSSAITSERRWKSSPSERSSSPWLRVQSPQSAWGPPVVRREGVDMCSDWVCFFLKEAEEWNELLWWIKSKGACHQCETTKQGQRRVSIALPSESRLFQWRFNNHIDLCYENSIVSPLWNVAVLEVLRRHVAINNKTVHRHGLGFWNLLWKNNP